MNLAYKNEFLRDLADSSKVGNANFSPSAPQILHSFNRLNVYKSYLLKKDSGKTALTTIWRDWKEGFYKIGPLHTSLFNSFW